MRTISTKTSFERREIVVIEDAAEALFIQNIPLHLVIWIENKHSRFAAEVIAAVLEGSDLTDLECGDPIMFIDPEEIENGTEGKFKIWNLDIEEIFA